MFTSCGYHTFTVSKNLTQETAGLVFEAFKKYMKASNEICIIECPKYDKDPYGRHYEIVYPGQEKGISWKMRFSNKGFFIDGEYLSCSIRATINPKTLTGEKSYIRAANMAYMNDIIYWFDYEAGKISPLLKGFSNYTLNRIDYCINFDVSELDFDYPAELKERLPQQIMQLMRHGDIPQDYREEYGNENQFYLKGGSTVINCYWKYIDLKKNFPDCRDLKDSYNIIRFEVQCKYPKAYQLTKKIKDQIRDQKSALDDELNRMGYYNMEFDLGVDYNCDSENGCKEKQTVTDEGRQRRMSDIDREKCRLNKINLMEMIISDKRCDKEITKYYNKVIKTGGYYTLKRAERIIEAKVRGWDKVVRLTGALEKVHAYGGISKVKNALHGKELEVFRRSLRELAVLGINPVTIPKEWGIEYIPNLLENYRSLCQKQQLDESAKQMNEGINI